MSIADLAEKKLLDHKKTFNFGCEIGKKRARRLRNEAACGLEAGFQVHANYLTDCSRSRETRKTLKLSFGVSRKRISADLKTRDASTTGRFVELLSPSLQL
jgi:hypothetical protein